jgi:hypothetical protein
MTIIYLFIIRFGTFFPSFYVYRAECKKQDGQNETMLAYEDMVKKLLVQYRAKQPDSHSYETHYTLDRGKRYLISVMYTFHISMIFLL